MESALNQTNATEHFSFDAGNEKSELMKVFEAHVNDVYWAYKDLFKEIIDAGDEAQCRCLK